MKWIIKLSAWTKKRNLHEKPQTVTKLSLLWITADFYDTNQHRNPINIDINLNNPLNSFYASLRIRFASRNVLFHFCIVANVAKFLKFNLLCVVIFFTSTLDALWEKIIHSMKGERIKKSAHRERENNMKLIFTEILVILANHNIKLLLIASIITLKFYEPHHSQHDKNQIDICLNGFSLGEYKCVCACFGEYVCACVVLFCSVLLSSHLICSLVCFCFCLRSISMCVFVNLHCVI